MAARAWRQNQRIWQVAPAFDGAEDLARQLGTSPVVAQILHNRGASSLEQARDFLNPRMNLLHGPELLCDIEPAARRIAAAIAAKEKITIYGDYDVDGMTSVAILDACLRMLGGQVDYYVPHRLEEGYGVNDDAIRKIIASGTRLLVTVDCGISAAEPLALATAAGIDVIVTDHHKPSAQLPKVLAIVHPALEGGTYPNAHLCGAGVAFKLAWQVAKTVAGRERLDTPMRDFMIEAMALAALGTIADVVPLVGENRIFATFGLAALPNTKHAGLRALLDSSGLAGEKLDAFHVGYVLAPRLNACGRMGHAAMAVELLTTAPAQRSLEIATYLNQQNESRQKVEREIADQAVEMVQARGMDRDDHPAIVLASDQWHGGVIGIVASRLVDRFHRPAVLIALGPDSGQGSGRSIAGFNLHDALAACSEHLLGFGGHAMAAGLRIAPDKIEPFTAAFVRHAREFIPTGQMQGTLHVDARCSLRSLDHNLASHLGKLAPFGQANPSPLLAFESCRVLCPPKRMGRNGGTINLVLGQNGANIRAVGFGMGDLVDELVGINEVHVAGEPVINSFNGRTSVELKLKDVQIPQ